MSALGHGRAVWMDSHVRDQGAAMEMPRIVRRMTAMVLALLIVLSGCNAGVGESEREAVSRDSAQSREGYPVTVETSLGAATIPRKPERIVTLGAGAEDIVWMLGEVPVGITAHYWGGDEAGYLPWFREALEAEGAPLPETIDQYPELDIERIYALDPDVILAPQSGLTQSEYEQLSTFVPVVAYPGSPWLTPVDRQIDLVAEALGKPGEGERLKRQLERTLARAGAAHPEIQGLDMAYVNAGSQLGSLSVYVRGDPRVETLLALGLELDPAIADLQPRRNSFSARLGLEHADRLHETDILVSWYTSPEQLQRVMEQPLFASIPAVQRGSHVAMTDQSLVMAMSYGTPLSVPWALDRFMNRLVEAARNAR